MSGKLLSRDIEKTLDLLEFVLETSHMPATGKDMLVHVAHIDLQKAGLEIEDLARTLHHLIDVIPGLKIEYMYDFVNGEGGGEFDNPDPYPSLADIALPTNFLEISERLRCLPHPQGNISRQTSVVSGKSLDKLEPEIQIDNLVSYNDGTIRFKDQILQMRPRLKDLCRIFMKNPTKLVTLDTIREEIIDHGKREVTPNDTISKYVSSLHLILQKYYQKKVIFNQSKDGWIFRP